MDFKYQYIPEIQQNIFPPSFFKITCVRNENRAAKSILTNDEEVTGQINKFLFHFTIKNEKEGKYHSTRRP